MSVVDAKRVGDSLEVTMRANFAVHTTSVRVLDGEAIAALPTWERSSWSQNERATWSFGLLADVDVATIRWTATEWTSGNTQTRDVDIVVPAGSFVGPLTLVGLSRSGTALTVSMRATENLSESTVRLLAGGAVAGLPEWQRTRWTSGERADWTFELLREIDKATLAWEVRPASGVVRSGSEEVQIPVSRDPTVGTSRVIVTSAALRGATAIVNVTNYGDATARNVAVAIEDAQQRRIGSPLTQILSSVASSAQASAEFTIPENVVDVVIALDAGNGTVRTPVTLQRIGAGSNATSGAVNVTLATDLPFREVDLGRAADYAVQVKNNGAPALVQLRIEGLPQGYSARFFVGGSAVPSLYLDRNQTRQATLSVTVPAASTEVDRTVDFAVVASVNGTEARRLGMGVAVRGVGTLEVSSDEGEAQIPAGGQATFEVTVKNTGSAPIFNVEFDSRRPYGWTVRVEPRRLDRLEPAATAAVSVEVRAPDVIGSGRYSVDVAARSGETTSRYTALAMNVETEGSGGGWVWGAFLVLIAGILGFAGWWKWRR